MQRLADEIVPTLPGAEDGSVDYAPAKDLFLQVAVADEFADFLTVPAYETMP